jgi:hypothetical protein
MTQLKHFRSFGIKTTSRAFTGDKIKMKKILDKEIIVHDFKIEKSKFAETGNDKRLDLQIELNGTKHVTWTSSGYLMDTLQKMSKSDFPFITTITQLKEENERYEFT